MAADTNVSGGGGEPQVTVSGGNLIRYRCRFYLWKPAGQTWPGTNSRRKKIHEVTLNKDHPPTDTFSLGDPNELESLALSWIIDMKVPGGGGPLQYLAKVEIEQDQNQIMNPFWTGEGKIKNTKSIGDDTEMKVTP
ncbi:MAG TPA: hypothetical protein VFH31_09550 [Pyrinomonadaceae bacterium]|nr:hypothetical protein [Pyrinomonadaceae bacterium]